MRAAKLAVCVALLLAIGKAAGQEGPVRQAGFKPFGQRTPPACDCPPGTVLPSPPADPNAKVDPKVDPKMDMPPAMGDQFAGATEAGTQPGSQFNPNMFGDLIGISGRRNVVVPGQFVNINPRRDGTPILVPATVTSQGLPIGPQYNGFKVTDNESPRPTNRLYFTYNHFSDVNRSLIPASIPSVSIDRQLLGFERTFMQGNASFGMRLPFIQFNGSQGIESNVVGDLSFLFKYAWLNDRETGNVVSTGLIVTAPTGGGPDYVLSDGLTAPRSTLIQPWAGFIYNLPNLFFQGFSSIVVPTDSRDPTILFNSIGAGYWLYRNPKDRFITGFVPVLEFHLNTPLNHRNINDAIFFQDQFNITTGAFVSFPRMTLGGAVCVPVVGPRPYDIEAIASLNFNF